MSPRSMTRDELTALLAMLACGVAVTGLLSLPGVSLGLALAAGLFWAAGVADGRLPRPRLDVMSCVSPSAP